MVEKVYDLTIRSQFILFDIGFSTYRNKLLVSRHDVMIDDCHQMRASSIACNISDSISDVRIDCQKLKMKMALSSKTIIILIIAMVVSAYHGYQQQPCSRTVGSSSATHLSRLGPIRGVRLNSATGGDSISADTVVARCTRKIVDSLNPKECTVTSTDDDPNGSHVS